MKKLLVAVSWPAAAPHPSLDCLLAASELLRRQADARFLLVAASSSSVAAAADLMLAEPPHSLKLLFLGCRPSPADAGLLRSLSAASCAYILEPGPPQGPVSPAPRVCLLRGPCLAALAAGLYPGRPGKLWERSLALLRLAAALDEAGLDRATSDDFAEDLADSLEALYGAARRLGSRAERLVYAATRAGEWAAALDWETARDARLGLLDRARVLIDRVLAVRDFVDAAVAGKHPQLFSDADLRAYRGREDAWAAAAASGRLVSVPVGEKHAPRFVGAVFLRSGESPEAGGPFWASPRIAEALGRRANAACLIQCARQGHGGAAEDADVRVVVHRTASSVDCLQVARGVVVLMRAGASVTLDGRGGFAEVVCGPEAFARLESRLKVQRSAVELRNARPVMPPRAPSPFFRPRSVRRPSQAVETLHSGVGSAPPPGRLRSRSTLMSLVSESQAE